jgi:8-oxo-dGTP pyrophosphatase MutT (NUDIX family)
MQQERRVNVRAIIYRNGHILAVKHKESDGSASSYYAVPGGGVDPMESLEDALRREIMEETGIEASVGRLLFIQQFASARKGFSEELEFFYEVTNMDDFDSIDLASTSHGHHEIAVCEFVDPSKAQILPRFLQKIDVGSYIASPQPTLVIDNFNE